MAERGLIVAIYGMNNIGKSTVIDGVMENLFGLIARVKYPVYDLIPSGVRLNDYLRHGNPENLTPFEAQKVFVENRWEYQPELIRIGHSHRLTILEDYKGTGIAWGVINDIPLMRMEEINAGLLEPDLSILLDGNRFVCGRENNHLNEGIDDGKWQAGREIHRELAVRYGWRTVGVKFGELDREVSEVTEMILVEEIRRRKKQV
jgi:thymidylate kinase